MGNSVEEFDEKLRGQPVASLLRRYVVGRFAKAMQIEGYLVAGEHK